MHAKLRTITVIAICSSILVVSHLTPVAGQAPAEESQPATTAPPRDFSRWEKEIAAFEAVDRDNPPPKGGVLFIGSSTIRLWKTLGDDFSEHKVINRGFGGSEIVDSTHFAERIIFPYEPRQIFLRAGGNDIHAGKTPREVAKHFMEFVTKVRTKLPKTEILYIPVNPAPARWGEKDKNQELNRLIRDLALHLPLVGYVDAADFTLDAQGQARRELFVADKLHFNEQGYKILAEKVRPYLTGGK